MYGCWSCMNGYGTFCGWPSRCASRAISHLPGVSGKNGGSRNGPASAKAGTRTGTTRRLKFPVAPLRTITRIE